MTKIFKLLWPLLGMVLCLPLNPAMARPVSYPGGVTLITTHDGDANTALLHYTLTPHVAVGALVEYWRAEEALFQGAALNILAKRWNWADAQANIYVKSGAGFVRADDDHAGAAFTGLSADWENRRFFVMAENRLTLAGDIKSAYSQMARLGVAPYVAEYGGLHTWLMLQLRHQPTAEDPLTLTPLVRVFKGTHLLEAGYSTNNTLLFTYIHRF